MSLRVLSRLPSLRPSAVLVTPRRIDRSRSVSISRSSLQAENQGGVDVGQPSAPEVVEDIQVDSEGDFYIDLGGQRRATVMRFKGAIYVDIREFANTQRGTQVPLKKGIALKPGQWEILKKNVDRIDELLKGVTSTDTSR